MANAALKFDRQLSARLGELQKGGRTFGQAMKELRATGLPAAPESTPAEDVPDDAETEEYIRRWAMATLRDSTRRVLPGLDRLTTQELLDWVSRYVHPTQFDAQVQAMFGA